MRLMFYNATNIASLNGSNSTDITTNYTLASVLAKSDLFSNNSVFSYTFSLLEHYRNELILIPEVIGFSVPMVVPVNGLLMGLSYDITNETDIRVVYGAGLRNNSLWVQKTCKLEILAANMMLAMNFDYIFKKMVLLTTF